MTGIDAVGVEIGTVGMVIRAVRMEIPIPNYVVPGVAPDDVAVYQVPCAVDDVSHSFPGSIHQYAVAVPGLDEQPPLLAVNRDWDSVLESHATVRTNP